MSASMVERAEILTVGTELLLGEIIDTNSAYLAAELAARSVDVYWTQRVGDNRKRIREAIAQAAARSHLVLITGGLGPTDDDLTREAIADLLAETPTVDANLEATLRARFSRYGREMPERNLKQAWLIPSAQALANPVGTAPGWRVDIEAGRLGQAHAVTLAALPGPPSELKPMWNEQLAPHLRFPSAQFVATTLKTFGLGESHVAELLTAWTEAANPSVATYAKRDGVHVRVAAKAADTATAQALLAPTLAAVELALAKYVWGRDQQELAREALAAVAGRGGRLAFIDGATGGRLSVLLQEGAVALAGGREVADGVLVGGMVASGDDALDALGVWDAAWAVSNTSDLTRVETDESEHAVAMAAAACARFATDHGVALTPWRVKATDGKERPSWTAFWAVVGPNGHAVQRVTLPPQGTGARDERLAFAVLFALWSMTKH